MVEPISAAGSSLAKGITSVVTKQLQSKSGTRLGSRDERRKVYSRFQAAAMDVLAILTRFVMEQRLYRIWIGKRRWSLTLQPVAHQRAVRLMLRDLAHAESELLQAYLDLRLVANPGPLEAADVVMKKLEDVTDADASAPDVFLAATEAVVEAQREFTDVCRDDLWYLPQRWQVYRIGWWKARRWRRRAAIEKGADSAKSRDA
ncbi:hypothetical protein ACYF6T_39145 [Streptomyces sp. 7R007]